MKKTLVLRDKKAKIELTLDVQVHLNKAIFTLFKKDSYYQKHVEYKKEYEFTIETNIDELIYEFYEEYVGLKSVELFWSDKLDGMDIVDISLEED